MAKFEDFIAATGPPTLSPKCNTVTGRWSGRFPISADMQAAARTFDEATRKIAVANQERMDKMLGKAFDEMAKTITFRGRRIEYDRYLGCYFSTDHQWRNIPWPRRYPVARPAFVDDSKQVFYGPQRKGLKR